MSDGFYTRQGKCSALNIAAATQVFTVPKDALMASSRLVRVQVLVAGSSAGSAYDVVGNATFSNVSAANQIGAWPNTVGSYLIDMPVSAGLVIVPGAGQTVSVSYD